MIHLTAELNRDMYWFFLGLSCVLDAPVSCTMGGKIGRNQNTDQLGDYNVEQFKKSTWDILDGSKTMQWKSLWGGDFFSISIWRWTAELLGRRPPPQPPICYAYVINAHEKMCPSSNSVHFVHLRPYLCVFKTPLCHIIKQASTSRIPLIGFTSKIYF